MTPAERERFDALVEEVIADLPKGIRTLLDEVPVIVEDRPDPKLLKGLADAGEGDDDLCGLHSGIAFTERSVESSGELPSDIYLFRHGILAQAGGWAGEDADDRVYEEIWITLLHEVGHQFGLDEDDLERLGFQ
jgi:predicted Zn-dependent protease with MMP-like domain